MSKSRFIWEPGDIEIEKRAEKPPDEKDENSKQDKGGGDADQTTKG